VLVTSRVIPISAERTPVVDEQRAASSASQDRTSHVSALLYQLGTTIVVDSSFIARARAVVGTIDAPITLGDGSVVTVRLTPFRVIADNIEVRVGSRAVAGLAMTLRSVAHLRGEVLGEPGSLAYLGVGANGAAGFIDRGPGLGRYTLRTTTGESRGLLSGLVRFDPSAGTSQPEVPLCGADDDVAGGVASGVAGAGDIPPGVTPVIEIAVDTDYEYWQIFDDATAATEYVATLYGAISAIYRRDTDATLSVVFLRLADNPDDLFNNADPLGQFRDYWLANMQDVHRDLAQLLTGRRNLPYGGVAWLNATCEDFGYSVTGYIIGGFADPYVPAPGNWDLIVVAHELGHNVGSHHTHFYGLDACDQGQLQRGSIMSYCHTNSGATANIDLRFHRVCANFIEEFLVSQACIASDCDGDGIEDAEAISAGVVLDTNDDGIPDGCQDCDGDGIVDPVAIANSVVADTDGDGRPDSCEPDCNGNGVPDSLDIALGTSSDAYGDGVPDECEPDCNNNGIADYSDIQANMSIDLGRDALIDACQDCDGDGIPDLVELMGSHSIWVGSANSGEVRELHPRSGVVIAVVPFGAQPVYDLAFGPDGLLYGSSGRVIMSVDPVSRVVTQVYQFASSVVARGLAFGPSGILYVALSTNRIEKIDVTSGQSLGPLTTNGAIVDPRDVCVRSDGRILVSCGDGCVRQYLPDGAGGPFIDFSGHPNDFVGVIELPNGGDIVVVSRAQKALWRFDGVTGGSLDRFDVQASNLLASPWGLATSADGRAVVATSATSSSTVNGYNNVTGYVERTYRVYGADAPSATAIAIAPASSSDVNGNLVPDSCEGPLGDLNGDGQVDAADLAIVLGAWGTPIADLNSDGTTDGADIGILLGNWT